MTTRAPESAKPAVNVSGAVTGKPRQKTESMADRLDALIIGVVLCSGGVYYLESLPFIQNFSWNDVPYMKEYSWPMPTVAIVVYLAFVHGVTAAESGPETSFDRVLNFLLRYWNLFLTIFSLFMFLGLAVPVLNFNLLMFPDWLSMVCDTSGARWRGPMFFYLIVFTFSKYIELLDTAFLIIRRKPVSFLHWYHHCTVLAYTWFAALMQFSPGWYFSTINCAVHTVMYWYYYRRACGVFLSYDKFITTIQLVQMVLGVAATAVWTIVFLTHKESCPSGHPYVVITASVVMYASYFYLFYVFFRARYDKNAKGPKPKDV